MTTIAVNGTPLQAAIDNAQPGDTLVPKAGGYAGRLKITKSISIKGDGGAIIDGGTGDGFVNIDVAAKAVNLSGLDVRHAGAAFHFGGDCSGSIVENCTIPVVDFMVRGTGTSQNGGNGFQFEKASGIEVRYCTLKKLRAPSSQYVVDGGAFEIFGASNINIHHNEVWDSVNCAEGGKNSTTPDSTDITIEDNIFHGRANPLTPLPSGDPGKLLGSYGMRLRALNRATIRRNVFDQVDYWALLFDAGGTYGGALTAIAVDGNTFRLTPGSNRMVVANPGIPLSGVTFDNSTVYALATTTRVAEINGVNYLPNQLAAFRTATGWEKASTWTVGPLPPIGPPPPPPPIDPCTSVKAERDAAIAQRDAAIAATNTALGQLTTANTALAAANARIAAAKAALG